MLNVKTPEEVLELISREFYPLAEKNTETVGLWEASGRILAEDIHAREYVPDFDRSTVDGYALKASDTFGCSESIPAVLRISHEILMGEGADFELEKDCCAAIPTGGAVPKGADCVVMLEYAEEYGDGTVGIMKAGAPGMNIIYRGDDVRPGKTILEKGRKLTSHDIGALAAAGICSVPVVKKLKIGVISTGDELVEAEKTPAKGQMRDVNSPMLASMFTAYGADVFCFGIIKDDRELLLQTLKTALEKCDAVVLSGGSSVGAKDASAYCIESVGELLLHGIAIKPGKPTLIGKAEEKPVIGLPGHPAAAWFIARLFVVPLLDRLTGRRAGSVTVSARLTENVSANHGRAQVTACVLEKKEGVLYARPMRSKSGLITQLSESDGFFMIDRDCEGLSKDQEVQMYRFEEF